MIETKKILLIGRSGRGKSTLANVITGTENKFEESSGSASKTKKIQYEQFADKETNYLIIDTPGIGDTKMSDNEVLDIIAEAVYLVRNGVDQVFFVTNNRFDQSEMATYNLLRTIIFDEEITKHTTITRTNFDDFKSEEKCQIDIDSMIKEAKEKKTELEKGIENKKEELKNLSLESELYQKKLTEIEQLNKELKTNITEIIESCQSRVVHVNNPPIDVKNKRKLDFNKKHRVASQEKLLEHLKKTCQGEVYKPKKLEELSNEIADDMDNLLRSRKELEEGMKKLKTDDKSSTDSQSSKTKIKNESELENVSEVSNKSESVVEKKLTEENSNLAIGEKISQLEDEKEKLKKEIAEKEKVIRQKVLKHIFNNIENISNELGGGIFLDSVVGEHKWENISPEFTSKGLAVKWLSQKFDYEQVQKWAKALGDNFHPKSDAGFCAWLRDNKKLTVEKKELLVHVTGNIEQLRKEYFEQLDKEVEMFDKYNRQLSAEEESWENIHEYFKYYKEYWEEKGFNYNQTKEWIEVGFQPHQYNLVAYARDKGYNSYNINVEELKKEYNKHWLELNFPSEKRNEITELRIGSELEGDFNLSDFVNLKKLYCNNNELTSLNFLNSLNSEKLEVLNISDNCFKKSDLTLFSRFVNLRWLNLGNQARAQSDSRNQFYGSLEPLKNLNKLRELFIDGTDIDSGLEYLSDSIQEFYCSSERRPEAKLKAIEQELRKYGKPEQKSSSVGGPSFNFAGLLQVWKKYRNRQEEKSEIIEVEEQQQPQIQIPPKGNN